MKMRILLLTVILFCTSIHTYAVEVVVMEVVQLFPGGSLGARKSSCINIYFDSGETEKVDLPDSIPGYGEISENYKVIVKQLSRFYSDGFKLDQCLESVDLKGTRTTTYIFIKG